MVRWQTIQTAEWLERGNHSLRMVVHATLSRHMWHLIPAQLDYLCSYYDSVLMTPASKSPMHLGPVGVPLHLAVEVAPLPGEAKDRGEGCSAACSTCALPLLGIDLNDLSLYERSRIITHTNILSGALDRHVSMRNTTPGLDAVAA